QPCSVSTNGVNRSFCSRVHGRKETSTGETASEDNSFSSHISPCCEIPKWNMANGQNSAMLHANTTR
ncbi:MAG: hypothetical protein KC443_18675, partial [Anaerolineales bacterium]|nr:hypothetical protein [Anaerolineales bacterium]